MDPRMEPAGLAIYSCMSWNKQPNKMFPEKPCYCLLHLWIAQIRVSGVLMCLALRPAHYQYFTVLSFTASCGKFAEKVLPQLKCKLLKLDQTSFFYYRCPLQFYIATTVHRDYLHFARNIYAEKKSCLNMSLHFLWCPRKFIIYEWDPHLIGVNSAVL